MSVILSATTTFDQPSGLYTYDYTVVNDGNTNVGEISLLVGGFPPYGVQPLPPDYLAPPGWTMYGAFSGTIALPPYSMSGGFYEWYGGYDANAIQPGTTGIGFSFTSRFAPTSDGGLNDYFLYGTGGDAHSGAIVAFGNTVVPSGADWLIDIPYVNPAVPEPATWVMLLIGFVALSAVASRRLTVQFAPTS